MRAVAAVRPLYSFCPWSAWCKHGRQGVAAAAIGKAALCKIPGLISMHVCCAFGLTQLRKFHKPLLGRYHSADFQIVWH